MKVKLKRAASLGGKDLAKGIHDLPDGVAAHWFFKALLKDGHIELLDSPPEELKAVEPPPVEEEVIEEDFRDESALPEEPEVKAHGKKKKRK